MKRFDMRNKKSMYEYLHNHKQHNDFNSPEAYSHNIKYSSLLSFDTIRELEEDDLEELYSLFNIMVEDFEEANHNLVIYQTGRSGGHMELYERYNECIKDHKGKALVQKKTKPFKVHSETEEYYTVEEEYTIKDWRSYCSVLSAFDDFYDELKKCVQALAKKLIKENKVKKLINIILNEFKETDLPSIIAYDLTLDQPLNEIGERIKELDDDQMNELIDTLHKFDIVIDTQDEEYGILLNTNRV